MLIKEYRIPLPLSVDEFQRGLLYAVSACSRQETGGGEGAEFLKQEDFTSDTIRPGHTVSGTYTKKIYRLRSKAPWVLQKLLPPEAFEIYEESWNAYPYCKTVLTNPGYMKENFTQIIETIHLPDNGSSDNPLNCRVKREIVWIDITDNAIFGSRNNRSEKDAKTFEADATERGPLEDDWQDEHDPIMCCYKLVSCNFKWTGLQRMIERTIHKQYPRVFGLMHRDAYLFMNEWYNMSMDEIREYEEETVVVLQKQMAEPGKRGNTCNDDVNNNK
uniref:Phosphatidylinositol transfer protein N-terminal domain-containing protein n=1 Tax=Caenorhabditis japonica TaxID=281687 RepID=A0A8R1DNM9_CAEJA